LLEVSPGEVVDGSSAAEGSKGFPLTEKLLQSWGDTGSNEESQHRPVLPVL